MNDPREPVSAVAGELKIARRPLLGLVAALGLVTRGSAGAALRAPEGPIDLETFVREAAPLAESLIGDTSRIGQDRYLHALAALAARLRDIPLPDEMRENSKNSAAKTFIGAHDFEAPFTLLHWRLESGARIGSHPHIYGNVVTLCLEGEVRVLNHEMVGERDFDRTDAFPVRRVNDQLLLPGDINLVSLEHGYVHGFEAGPSGAHGLDITTRIREKRSSPSMLLEPEPVDAARGLFTARWQP